MAPSAERPFRELLEALAERSPAPGGGSAAAWAGALAAALLEMTATFAGLEEVVARASMLRAGLLAAGEAELVSYSPVLAAARLDPSDPSRRSRLDQALSDACKAPLAIAEAAAEVAERSADVAARATRELRGDAIAGVLLGQAAAESAARLVEINLRDQDDDSRLARAGEMRDRAHAARARAIGR